MASAQPVLPVSLGSAASSSLFCRVVGSSSSSPSGSSAPEEKLSSGRSELHSPPERERDQILLPVNSTNGILVAFFKQLDFKG